MPARFPMTPDTQQPGWKDEWDDEEAEAHPHIPAYTKIEWLDGDGNEHKIIRPHTPAPEPCLKCPYAILCSECQTKELIDSVKHEVARTATLATLDALEIRLSKLKTKEKWVDEFVWFSVIKSTINEFRQSTTAAQEER